MTEEERQRLLAEMARRSPEDEAAGRQQHEASVGRAERQWRQRGCLFFVIAIPVVLVFVHFFVTPLVKREGSEEGLSRSALAEVTRGPIPRRFQGAYNTMGCRGVHMDGLITVSGRRVSFTSVNLNVDEVVSQSDRSVTLRGTPSGIGFRESERTYTITHAEVGSTASLDGVRAERCSQY